MTNFLNTKIGIIPITLYCVIVHKISILNEGLSILLRRYLLIFLLIFSPFFYIACGTRNEGESPKELKPTPGDNLLRDDKPLIEPVKKQKTISKKPGVLNAGKVQCQGHSVVWEKVGVNGDCIATVRIKGSPNCVALINGDEEHVSNNNKWIELSIKGIKVIVECRKSDPGGDGCEFEIESIVCKVGEAKFSTDNFFYTVKKVNCGGDPVLLFDSNQPANVTVRLSSKGCNAELWESMNQVRGPGSNRTALCVAKDETKLVTLINVKELHAWCHNNGNEGECEFEVTSVEFP